MTPRYTAMIEGGRFVSATLALSISAGIPVKQSIGAAGSVRPYGRLGRITYGPAALTLQWHPLPNAAVRPYVGAGAAYMHVFRSDDGALQRLDVEDDVGPVIQGGVEVPLDGPLSLFADVKKGWLRTTATGSLGGLPIESRIRLDPLVLGTGLAIRF